MSHDQHKYTELMQALQPDNTAGSSMPGHELDTYKMIWDSATQYSYTDNSETAANWQYIEAALQNKVVIQPVRPVFRLSYLKWAAAIILAIGLGWATIYQLNKPEPVMASAEATYQTVNGETKTITLQDGSTIILNAGSVLTVGKGFNESDRRVSFRGEAFFDIAKDAERPFIISHNHTSITVLGTSFNVVCYPESNILKVALKTGKVRMAHENQHLDIVPGEVGIYDQTTGSFSKTVLNPDKELGWMSDKMVFDNEKLRTVITELERKYGVTFSYDTALDNEKITVTFHNQSLDQVVSVLQKTLNTPFTYSRN